MKNKFPFIVLLLVGMIASLSTAKLIPVPGFMDAEYYYSGGIMLFSGHGFNENFIWNYLDDPSGLPHPAFTYWMPLPSILAALGMWIGGTSGFFSARILFILLAGSIPALTFAAALSFPNDRKRSIIAGLFSVFPIFYGINLANTETFAIYMIFGWLFINTAFRSGKDPLKSDGTRFFYLGLISGILHLSRAEGFFWFVIALVISVSSQKGIQLFSKKWICVITSQFLLILIGYGLIMGPWYFRNISTFGYLFPPGNSHALWLTNYDQLFSFPASKISFHNWLASGWENILKARWNALTSNLQTMFAVQGQIVLFPLVLLGFWKSHREERVRFSAMMWGLMFLLMSFVFPFAGSRGGFFHTGSAFQIIFWVMAVEGLGVFIDFGVKKRDWNPVRSWGVFSSFLVILLMIISIVLFSQRVYGKDPSNMLWKAGWNAHNLIWTAMDSYGANHDALIMINNPPGYFAATLRPSIVIPDGDEKTAVEAAKKYNVDFLVLEKNHPAGLNELYSDPKDTPGLFYLSSNDGIHFFKFQ